MLRIVVLVKMVPDVSQLRFNPETNALIREGVKNTINPFDRRAVEAGVIMREKEGGQVVTVSMGPPSAEEFLRSTLAAGADRAVLLTDPAFAGSDTLATSTALSTAIRSLGFDIVLGGVASVDAETSQVIPEIAQLLEAPLVTNARSIEADGSTITVVRDFEGGTETYEVELPAVLSVNEKINHPRIPSEEARVKATQMLVERWPASSLSSDMNLFGAAGSPTFVKSLFDASYQRRPVIFDGRDDLPSAASKCLAELSRLLAEAPSEAADMSRATEPKPVWVVVMAGSQETRTAQEVMGKVRGLGLRAVAVIAPDVGEDLVASSAEAGAEEVLRLGAPSGTPSASVDAMALRQAIEHDRPFAVLLPSTVKGREVAGRLAASLRLGLTGDATDISLHRRGDLIQVKPAFGGSVMAEVISKTSPRMATIRPGVFPLLSFAPSQPSMRSLETGPFTSSDAKLVLRTVTMGSRGGDLDRAKVIICGGFGVGSREAFQSLESYATGIGAAVAATRKAVDAGWAPTQAQVGLTGRSVHPLLMVEVGVSGSANHYIGLRRARLVLSVNSDPEAPSFKYCDVGLVADLVPALDALEDGLRNLAFSIGRTK